MKANHYAAGLRDSLGDRFKTRQGVRGRHEPGQQDLRNLEVMPSDVDA